MVISFYISARSVWEFQLLYILANIWHCSTGYLVVLIFVSRCLVMLSIFSCVYCLFFGEVSLYIFCLYVVRSVLTADLWLLYVLKVANIFSWYVCVRARAHSVVSLCLTLPPGSSVHGIFQARILEQVAVSFSRGSSLLRGGTRVSCVWFFPSWATKGAVSQYCDLHFHFLDCVF